MDLMDLEDKIDTLMVLQARQDERLKVQESQISKILDTLKPISQHMVRVNTLIGILSVPVIALIGAMSKVFFLFK